MPRKKATTDKPVEKDETPDSGVTVTAEPKKEELDFSDPSKVTIDMLKKAKPIRLIFKKVNKFEVNPKLVDEILGLTVIHKYENGKSVRKVLTNLSTKKELNDLAEYFSEVQAYRDRVTEILINYTVLRRDIQYMISLAEAYIFQFPVVTKLKTEKQRSATISEIIKPIQKKLIAVKDVISACEITKNNLDNTYFTLKAVKDITFAILNLNPDKHVQV